MYCRGCWVWTNTLPLKHAPGCELEWATAENLRLSAEVERLTLSDKVRGDRVIALSNALAREQDEVERLVKANEGWHTRIRQLKLDVEVYEATNEELRAALEAKTAEVERLKSDEDDWRERFAALQGELLGTQDACEGLRTALATAQAALSTAERKLDFCTKDYENVAREMSKHLGRPFTSHATDAVIILLDALATARAWIDGADHYPSCRALTSRDRAQCTCGWAALLERGAQ